MVRMISIQGMLALLLSSATFHSVGDANLSQSTIFENVGTEQRLRFAREVLAKEARLYLNHRTENVRSLSQYIFEISGDVKITRAILHESRRYGIDPLFLTSLIEQESKFQVHIRGTHGEIGLMQIKPKTAQWISRKAHLPWKGKGSLDTPAWNLRYGVAYLMYLKHHVKKPGLSYVDAYNMGQGKLNKRHNEGDGSPTPYSVSIRKRFTQYYARLDRRLQISESNLTPLFQRQFAFISK